MDSPTKQTSGSRNRFVSNFSANVYAQVITVVTQFAGIPILLAFWSSDQLGEWILLTALPSYLTFAEAGFATIAANDASMAVVRNDRKAALVSIHTAWGLLCAIASILVVAVVTVSQLFPLHSVFKIHTISPDSVKWTLTILGLYTVLVILSGIFPAIYRAGYQNARCIFYLNTIRLVEFVALIGTLACVPKPTAAALSILLSRLLGFAAVWVDSKTTCKGLDIGLENFSKTEVLRTWRQSLSFAAFPLGNALYFQGLTIVVGLNLNPSAVVEFNTVRTLTRVMVQYVTIIKVTTWPEFSYLFGKGEINKARKLNQLALELALIGATVIGALLAFFGPWFTEHWTRGYVNCSPILLGSLILAATLNSVWFITSGVLMGTNNHTGIAGLYIIATLTSCIAAFICTSYFGSVGAGVAMVFCEIMMLPICLRSAASSVNQAVSSMILSALQLQELRNFFKTRAAHR